MEKKFYRPDEVAEKLSISVQMVYKQIQAGDICAIKIGSIYRIPATALDDLINKKSDDSEIAVNT